MKIIIGLGNPGEKYEDTWHNIGFLVLDEFQKEYNFSDFSPFGKASALVSQGVIENEKIILAKPTTYMNESGRAAQEIISFYKLEEKDLIVAHDEIDLILGKIKISSDRGSAGHKGVDSLFSYLGGQGFIRLRIGISPDLKKSRKALDFVLKKFGRGDGQRVKTVVKKSCEALYDILTIGSEKAMSKYNQ